MNAPHNWETFQRPRRRVFTDQQRADAVALAFARGKQAAASELGISPHTLTDWIARHHRFAELAWQEQAHMTATQTATGNGTGACGLVLFDDEHEHGICTDCDRALNSPPRPPAGRDKPLCFYLKPLGPDGLAQMAQAITETGVNRAEEQAAGWARDHDFDERARSRYVGDVRGRAFVEYSTRCQTDAQSIGGQLGWGSGR